MDDHVLKYADAPPSSQGSDMQKMLRKCAAELYKVAPAKRPTSAANHLGARSKFILALDAPGVSDDIFSYPLSWSPKNCIAVGCGLNVYYQNLDTREIAHLCKLRVQDQGFLHTLEWGSKDNASILALATTAGSVELWDGEVRRRTRSWFNDEERFARVGAGAISWYEQVLAAGRQDGSIHFYDTRSGDRAARLENHHGKITGLKWNTEGTMLASSDVHGVVMIWDARAGKALSEVGPSRTRKMKHRAAVKVSIFLLVRLAQTTC